MGKYRKYKKKPTSRPKGHTNAPPEIRKRFGKAKVCTRGVAAFILGIGLSELRRREQDGTYSFVMVDQRGRGWYDEGNLRRIAGDTAVSRSEHQVGRPLLIAEQREQRVTAKEMKTTTVASKAARSGYSPELAAEVFAELNAGKSLDVIVIEKKVHPEDVFAIAEAWARLKGYILLNKDRLQELNHLPWRADWPPKNPAQMVLILRNVMESDLQRCVKCQRGYARLCASCVPKTVSPQEEKPHPPSEGENGASKLEVDAAT